MILLVIYLFILSFKALLTFETVCKSKSISPFLIEDCGNALIKGLHTLFDLLGL